MKAKFTGEPKTTWLTSPGDDRLMKMIDEFRFTDRNGKVWTARPGALINGASIPRPLWSIVGSPFVGDYRRASIVHDVARQEARGRGDRRRADRMFYQACRAGGCSVRESILLYVGVRIGAWWRYRVILKEEFVKPHVVELDSDKNLRSLFSMAADEVLQSGETDDIDELEYRVDSVELNMEEKALPIFSEISFSSTPDAQVNTLYDDDSGELDNSNSIGYPAENHTSLPLAAEQFYRPIAGMRPCGEEDRLPCENHEEFPCSAVCYLIMTKSLGRASRGTGFFISPDTIVTAGHCLRSGYGAVKSIQVIPGRMGNDWPFGSVMAKRWFVPQQWSRDGDSRFDYGVIKLSENVMGESTGNFYFDVLDDKELLEAVLTTSGYPSDMALSTLQYYNSGPCKALEDQRLVYSLDTWKGASGSPVWVEREGKPCVVGIHNYGHCPNRATRINERVFSDLKRWVEM